MPTDQALTALTAEAIDKLMDTCFFTEEELTEGAVIAEGVTRRFGFHPLRLASQREEIKSLLSELPDLFREEAGGSFLSAGMDRAGRHWGGHPHIEALLVLGLASGLAMYTVPRRYWIGFPGGMPYFRVMVS